MQSLTAAQSWILKGLVFLLPLFFLPTTSNFIDLNKLALLVVLTVIALFVWAISQTKTDFKLRVTPFDLPVLALALVVLVSTLIMTPNLYDAFVNPGTTTLVLSGTILYFVLTQYFKNSGHPMGGNGLWTALLWGGALAAVVAIFAGVGGFGLLGNYVTLPAWLIPNTFNTLGGVLPAITYFIAILPVGFGKLRQKGSVAGILLVLVLAIAVLTYWAVPGRDTSPRLLPLGTGWSISLETLKQSPLFGVGPGNFVEAFNRFRPVDFNSSEVWTLRFATSSNWYFHIWTVAGILGLAAFLWITLVAIRLIRSSPRSFGYWALATVLVLLALVPGNALLLVLLYIYLAYVGASRGQDISLHFGAQSMGGTQTNLVPGIIALVALILGALVAYFGVPVYLADAHFKNALDGYLERDSKKVGDEILAAVRQNPRVDTYRIFYGQVALESVNSRAVGLQGKEVTDQDRQTIASLIQLAIRESRAATAVNINRSQNWANLARTYQSIIPFTQDADRFAIASYQQAIALEPTNPIHRVSLGGVFYALKNYDEAVKSFELAVAAKPDYANAHYNLAIALREKGDIARAAQEMAIVRRLVPDGSQDAETAQKELDSLLAKVKEQQATPSGQVAGSQTQGQQPPLQAPVQQEQRLNPPIDLPEEAAPPSPALSGEEQNPEQPQR